MRLLDVLCWQCAQLLPHLAVSSTCRNISQPIPAVSIVCFNLHIDSCDISSELSSPIFSHAASFAISPDFTTSASGTCNLEGHSSLFVGRFEFCRSVLRTDKRKVKL
jgi:hypothetical protein